MDQMTRRNPQVENLTPPQVFFLWFIIGLANLFDVLWLKELLAGWMGYMADWWAEWFDARLTGWPASSLSSQMACWLAGGLNGQWQGLIAS